MTANSIQVFNFTETTIVRTVTIGADLWFVAADVANILGYSETNRMTEKLDEDETLKAIHGIGGILPNQTLINESGLYSSILRSQKFEAKKFKKWVTSEVLPSIRKTGGYKSGLYQESPVSLVREILKAATEDYGLKPEMAKAVLAECAIKLGAPDAILKIVGTVEQANAGYINPTMIAERIGWLSKTGKGNGRRVNDRLLEIGFQYKDERGDWRVTEKGREYGESRPYKNGSHSGYQTLWAEKVLEVLQ